MHKLIASYMVVFLLFAYFSSVAEGGGGLVATNLTADVTDDATTLVVTSTQGFLEADSVTIRDEEIAYNGITATQFQNCERGQSRTDAIEHNSGDAVYSSATSVINTALGFNVISTGEAYGVMAVVLLPIRFFTSALAYLVSFNFGILGGQMLYLRYIFMAPAVGLVVYFAFTAMGTAFGMIRK